MFGVLNSLAFGAYDRSFQDFFTSFWEMILECFGLFKPAASTPYVLSLFKYATHVLPDTDHLSWLPLVLQIMFKTVVVLLLFKLLMGVIMESYKKHAKLKGEASTVRSDLQELLLQFCHYIVGHRIMGRAYVSLFQLALALALGKAGRESDRPWEKHFLGLDDPSRIKSALNGVLSPNQPQRVQALVKHHGCTECSNAELAYVLRVYGTRRQRAEALFKGYFIEHEKKLMQKAELKKHKSKEKESEDKLEEQLEDVLKNLGQGQINSGWYVPVDSSNPLDDLSEDELQDIFDEYDFLNIGTVDHRLMPQLFRQLGYDISPAELSNFLHDYDNNEDGDTSFKEFLAMLSDDRLVGLYHKKPRRSRNWRVVRHHMHMTTMNKRMSHSWNPGALQAALLEIEPGDEGSHSAPVTPFRKVVPVLDID